MDPPLGGSTAMSHHECTIRELTEPQEASPMTPARNVRGIDRANRVLHALGTEHTGKSGLRTRFVPFR